MITRLVWFVLDDGTSVVAGCGTATRDAVAVALQNPRAMLTLRSRDAVEQLAACSIREFVVFDATTPALRATAIQRSLQL